MQREDTSVTETDVLMAHMDGLFESLKGWLVAIIVLLVILGIELAMVIGRLS